MHTLPSRLEPIPQSTGTSAKGRALVLALLLVGLWLRIHQLANKSLWLDEAFSVWMSEQPLPDLFSWTVQIDQHPPLYYVILRAWAQIGGSHASPTTRAFWIRLPSAFFSTLTIAVIYALGRRFAVRRAGLSTGLLAALLLALSPFHVWFGQETRMYALLALNASLAMLGLVRLLTLSPLQVSPCDRFGRPREGEKARRARSRFPSLLGRTAGCSGLAGTKRWQGWALYTLFTAAALWTHNTAILFWAAANLYVLGIRVLSRRRRPTGQETGFSPKDPVSLSVRHWLLAQLAVLLLWSPWLAPFGRQAADVDREFWIPAPTWSTVAGTLNAFLSAFLPQQLAWQGLAWLAAGILLVTGVYALWKTPAMLALLVTLFVTPIAGELLVSLRRPIFYTRTLIWASVPFYLLLSTGAAHALSAHPGLKARWRAAAAVAACLSLGVLVTANARSLQHYYTKTQTEAWDQAAEHLSQHVQPGDLILFNATWVQLPFDFYFDPPVPVTQRGLPIDLFDLGVLEPKMAEQDLPYLESLIQGHSRVWLIYSHNWYTDPQGLIPDALADRGRLVERQHFRGIVIHLYQRP